MNFYQGKYLAVQVIDAIVTFNWDYLGHSYIDMNAFQTGLRHLNELPEMS